MNLKRVALLAGVAAILCGVLVWRWISDWGLITMDYTDAPLAKVIKSMERQGGIKIATNADPSTPVTILLQRSPVFDAVDTLAERLEGDARLAYIAAPDKKQISDVLKAFITGDNPGGWSIFASGFGGGGGPMGGGDTMIDPRQVEWKVSDSEKRDLQAILQQGAQKTSALFAVPGDWNPVIGKLPAKGKTGKVTTTLIKTANGQVDEVFLITVRPTRVAGEPRPDTSQPRLVFSPPRGNRENMNPEWMAERAQAQIDALPAEERAEAQKQYDEMRAFWESIRKLPAEERRAKIEELMNNPEVQEKIEERMSTRDSKRTPAQRERRMKRYVERKQEMKQRQ